MKEKCKIQSDGIKLQMFLTDISLCHFQYDELWPFTRVLVILFTCHDFYHVDETIVAF